MFSARIAIATRQNRLQIESVANVAQIELVVVVQIRSFVHFHLMFCALSGQWHIDCKCECVGKVGYHIRICAVDQIDAVRDQIKDLKWIERAHHHARFVFGQKFLRHNGPLITDILVYHIRTITVFNTCVRSSGESSTPMQSIKKPVEDVSTSIL